MSNSKNYIVNRFSGLLQQQQSELSESSRDSEDVCFFQANFCQNIDCSQEPQQAFFTPIKQLKSSNSKKLQNFKLQSKNFQLFKRKIQQKSSLSSFHAYTPSKDSEKQHFTIINEISTIENTNTRTNEFLTQRFPFHEETQDEVKKQGNHSLIVQRQYIKTQQDEQEQFKMLLDRTSNDMIRVEITDNEDIEIKKVNKANNNIKKHHRTLTEAVQLTTKKFQLNESPKNTERQIHLQNQTINHEHRIRTVYKITLLTQSKNSSTQKISFPEYQIQNSLHSRKPVLRTKQMSNKLKQSSCLQFKNSTPLNSTTDVIPSIFFEGKVGCVKLKGRIGKKS